MKTTLKAIAQTIIVLSLIGGLVFGLRYIIKTEQQEQIHLYQVSFGNTLVWTKEIKFRTDGGAEFVDMKTNRKFIVYGSYAIIEPKTK